MDLVLIVGGGLVAVVVLLGLIVTIVQRGERKDLSQDQRKNLSSLQRDLRAAEKKLKALRSPQPIADCSGVALYDDYRVMTPEGEHDITESTKATVDTAGNLSVTRRGTLTRFALLGFGPALLFKKKDVHDRRELYLLLEDSEWASVVACNPDEGLSARKLAQAINLAAQSSPRSQEDRDSLRTERRRSIGRQDEVVRDLKYEVQKLVGRGAVSGISSTTQQLVNVGGRSAFKGGTARISFVAIGIVVLLMLGFVAYLGATGW